MEQRGTDLKLDDKCKTFRVIVLVFFFFKAFAPNIILIMRQTLVPAANCKCSEDTVHQEIETTPPQTHAATIDDFILNLSIPVSFFY